jgi:PAS domain S-box-containing protein
VSLAKRVVFHFLIVVVVFLAYNGVVYHYSQRLDTPDPVLAYATLLMAVAATLALGGSIALVWTRIVVPIKQLKRDAMRAFQRELPSPGEDDIRAVAAVFNEMSADLGRLRHEREEVAQELARVEADYRSIFDNAVAGIFQFDAAGSIIVANPAFARMVGYERPKDLVDAIGNVHQDLYADPQHRARFEEMFRGGEGTIEAQTQIYRRDGTVMWVLESAAVVRRSAAHSWCDAVVVDISSMKKAQESLRELSGLLLHSQEQERRRIARELHDSTGQVLAALEMNLHRLNELVPVLQDTLSSSSDLAATCSKEIRSVSYLLHPPLLEDLGLVFTLRDYAEGFAARTGIEVTLDLPGEPPRFSPDLETALFRVAQEALTNIHRHAATSDARVRLEVGADEIVLEVEDHGQGISPELLAGEERSLSRMGVGMRGMEERLRQLGGCLDIRSSCKGTTVTARLPLSQDSVPTRSLNAAAVSKRVRELKD